MLYLSADQHWNHANILIYTSRPFKSLKHMNRELVRRWNNVVDPEDTVIHLGDLCFPRKGEDHRYWREQLNGNITFVKGNHDRGADAPIQSLILKYGGVDWWCEHYPVQRYRHNLCAHVHDRWKIRKVGLDVIVNCAVDVWGYAPISMEQILQAVKEAPRGESL